MHNQNRPRTIAQYAVRALAGLALVGAFGATHAASYPDRPVSLIVPFTPGGSTDVLGRALADRMSRILGQTVVVENVPGANTIIGADKASRAKPDGYTLMVAAGSTLVLNPLLYADLPYQPEKDLQILSLLTEVPLVLVVPPNSPATSVQSFTEHARKQAGKLNYASVGTGSSLHLAGELYKSKSAVDMTHVPYKGSAPALTDLLAGQVDAMFDALPTAGPLVASGKLKALGVTSSARVPTMPTVPPIADTYPGFQAVVWYALVAPQGIPEPVAQKIKAAADQVLQQEGFRKNLSDMGFVVQQPAKADAIATYVTTERDRWKTVIDSAKISLTR